MNESSSPAPAPVSPLWTRDFTIITLGSVISMLGNSMSGFALSLLVLDYTGSNLLYAIYIATFTLSQIVMPIFSGAILDRFSRKKTIYTLDFLSSGVYLVAALILSRGWFSFPMLAVFCFIIGSINSIYYVAYDSFYPLLISEGNYSKAYSIASVLETLSALIIPIATYFIISSALRRCSASTRCASSSPRRRRRRSAPRNTTSKSSVPRSRSKSSIPRAANSCATSKRAFAI